MRVWQVMVLGLGLVSPIACQKRGPATGGRPEARRPPLPEPLPLPADPAFVVHIQRPGELVSTFAEYAQDPRSPIQILQDTLATTPRVFEHRVAGWLDLSRPWDAAAVGDQLIASVPISRAAVASLQDELSRLPTEGSFGAVVLPRDPSVPQPQLAWLDPTSATLTLASDLRGLMTGSKLAAAYGTKPVRIRAERELLRSFGVELLAGRVELTGSDPHNLEIRIDGVPEDLPELARFGNGALTGMLEARTVTAGASSRYLGYARDVRELNRDIGQMIDAQSFLVRPVLAELHQRLRATLAAWNGRVMIGVGPPKHLLLGAGAEDAKVLGRALLHFVRGVVDNIALARSFGLGGIPQLQFRQDWKIVEGTRIHTLTVRRAKAHLPPELVPLLDESGNLDLAVSFPDRLGGAMAVVGPDAPGVLSAWLQQTTGATPARESERDFAALTLAWGPADLARVFREPVSALSLTAASPPTQVVARRDGGRVDVSIRRPGS